MEPGTPPRQEGLSGDFKELGDNLLEMLRAAWDRPERKGLENEIRRGMNELSGVLTKAASDFDSSEAGQKVKTGVSDFRTRVDRGEVEENLRNDIRSALQAANREIRNFTSKIQPTDDTDLENEEV